MTTADSSAATPTGLKKVWNDTVDQVQASIKTVEEAIKGQLEDGKKRLEDLSGQPAFSKFEDVISRFRLKERVEEIVDDTQKLTDDTIEKLGVARVADIDILKSTLEKLTKKVETVRRKASDGASKKTVAALVKRVEALEAKLAAK